MPAASGALCPQQGQALGTRFLLRITQSREPVCGLPSDPRLPVCREGFHKAQQEWLLWGGGGETRHGAGMGDTAGPPQLERRSLSGHLG